MCPAKEEATRFDKGSLITRPIAPGPHSNLNIKVLTIYKRGYILPQI